MMDTTQAVQWILQSKELIALISLIFMIHFIMTKHIPMLLIREEKKQERDREILLDQSRIFSAAIGELKSSVNSLGDKLVEAIDHLREVTISIQAPSNPKKSPTN